MLFLVQAWAPSVNFAMSLICSLVFGSRGCRTSSLLGNRPNIEDSVRRAAECQQEVEAAHPVPAWGRWKRNASRIVTRMMFLPLRCRLIILLRCRLTMTRLLLLQCRRIMTRMSRSCLHHQPAQGTWACCQHPYRSGQNQRACSDFSVSRHRRRVPLHLSRTQGTWSCRQRPHWSGQNQRVCSDFSVSRHRHPDRRVPSQGTSTRSCRQRHPDRRVPSHPRLPTCRGAPRGGGHRHRRVP